MKKWAAVMVCAALCLVVCAATALAVLNLLRPEDGQTRYVLRDLGGQAALFEPGADAPVSRYEIYTALLPEEDAEALCEGIPIADSEELQRVLEDLGL